jgi:hypothetical protein
VGGFSAILESGDPLVVRHGWPARANQPARLQSTIESRTAFSNAIHNLTGEGYPDVRAVSF